MYNFNNLLSGKLDSGEIFEKAPPNTKKKKALFSAIMEKLKAGEFLHLTDYVLKILSQNHITTILQFLQEDTEKLSTLTKLSLPQILAVRNDIFKKYSAPVVNGSALLIKGQVNQRFLSTGIHK